MTREELHAQNTMQIDPVKEENNEPEIIEVSNNNYEENDNFKTKDWKYPPITLLKKNEKSNSKENNEAIKTNVPIIMQVLRDFGIDARVVAHNMNLK